MPDEHWRAAALASVVGHFYVGWDQRRFAAGPTLLQLLVVEQFLVGLLLGFAFGFLEVDVFDVVGMFRTLFA